MDDFANFTPKNTPKNTPKEREAPADPPEKDDAAWLKEADALLKEYSGRSEEDILKAIYARAVQGKREGTLTNGQIDAFYAQISPMLDGFKRRKLKKLAEELKRM